MPANSRKRDPVATRQRILECAATLLAEGEGKLEMAWVARAAGVSSGLAYHHFGSKEGLLVAVVNDFYDRLEAASLMLRFDDARNWELIGKLVADGDARVQHIFVSNALKRRLLREGRRRGAPASVLNSTRVHAQSGTPDS